MEYDVANKLVRDDINAEPFLIYIMMCLPWLEEMRYKVYIEGRVFNLNLTNSRPQFDSLLMNRI